MFGLVNSLLIRKEHYTLDIFPELLDMARQIIRVLVNMARQIIRVLVDMARQIIRVLVDMARQIIRVLEIVYVQSIRKGMERGQDDDLDGSAEQSLEY